MPGYSNYFATLLKEIDFLKLLVARFETPEQVDALELEVALHKSRDVFEALLKLKLAPDGAKPKKQDTAPAHATVYTKAATEKTVSRDAPQRATAATPERPATTPKKPAAVAEDERRVTAGNVPQQKATAAVAAAPATLADKISPHVFAAVNETLAQQKSANDLSSRLQTAPLDSIASGMGLNDRFLYIRELFGGDGNMYGATVKHLDATGSLREALDFVQRNFDWDMKNDTVQKFVSLIHRRHSGS